MKRLILSAACLSVASSLAIAQGSTAISEEYQLTPVWEYLNIHGSEVHPWLRVQPGEIRYDGTSEQDFFTTLIRYDDERLLLVISENGIDETNATAEELAIAEQFPDRSLIWINPNDGSPMGVALTIGLEPAPDSEFFIQKTTGTHPDGPTTGLASQWLLEFYPQVAVDGDGYLYISDKHKVLRYTPNASGGFDGPNVVFTYPEEDPPGWLGSTNQHYRRWRMHSLNVVGSGSNKVMTSAARHWLDGGGVMYYTSSDGGASWTIQQHNGQTIGFGGLVGTGGAASAPIQIEEFGEEWVFGAGFPGSSSTIHQFIRPIGSTGEFIQMPNDMWNPQIDPADVDDALKYNGGARTDVAAAEGVPFIAVLNIPMWQSRNNPDLEEATAWVALNSITLDVNEDMVEGGFLASYQIESREKDEPHSLDAGDNWTAAYTSTINMHVLNDGTVEILWSGGNNGFGRLVVGDVEVMVNDWSLF